MVNLKEVDEKYRVVKSELYEWANRAHDELGMPYVMLEDMLTVMLMQVTDFSQQMVDSRIDVRQEEESEILENESE